MAKIAFVLIFSLVLLISIHAVLGDDNFMETAKGAAESMSESASDAFKEAKETTSTWGDWFKDKFHDVGLGSEDHDHSSKTPESG
ncbi:hypothetical protein D8674_015474 [Pyrus ussuriensis x Pyrus communis]|uniref:Uncharacterized protein n=1 Tax=Pyrus ussuriensis x Pyrus communis TaxID=2448454 RepID=A0A5N5GVG8_9ROSA|nr:hypothetical protein D8674_015474 [Pyrus ussuriensis x Pyrus communis]